MSGVELLRGKRGASHTACLTMNRPVQHVTCNLSSYSQPTALLPATSYIYPYRSGQVSLSCQEILRLTASIISRRVYHRWFFTPLMLALCNSLVVNHIHHHLDRGKHYAQRHHNYHSAKASLVTKASCQLTITREEGSLQWSVARLEILGANHQPANC